MCRACRSRSLRQKFRISRDGFVQAVDVLTDIILFVWWTAQNQFMWALLGIFGAVISGAFSASFMTERDEYHLRVEVEAATTGSEVCDGVAAFFACGPIFFAIDAWKADEWSYELSRDFSQLRQYHCIESVVSGTLQFYVIMGESLEISGFPTFLATSPIVWLTFFSSLWSTANALKERMLYLHDEKSHNKLKRIGQCYSVLLYWFVIFEFTHRVTSIAILIFLTNSNKYLLLLRYSCVFLIWFVHGVAIIYPSWRSGAITVGMSLCAGVSYGFVEMFIPYLTTHALFDLTTSNSDITVTPRRIAWCFRWVASAGIFGVAIGLVLLQSDVEWSRHLNVALIWIFLGVTVLVGTLSIFVIQVMCLWDIQMKLLSKMSQEDKDDAIQMYPRPISHSTFRQKMKAYPNAEWDVETDELEIVNTELLTAPDFDIVPSGIVPLDESASSEEGDDEWSEMSGESEESV